MVRQNHTVYIRKIFLVQQVLIGVEHDILDPLHYMISSSLHDILDPLHYFILWSDMNVETDLVIWLEIDTIKSFAWDDSIKHLFIGNTLETKYNQLEYSLNKYRHLVAVTKVSQGT